MRKNIGGKGLDLSRNTSEIVDLKENIDLSRKEVGRGLLVGDFAKQRLRGENVHEICLGGIWDNN